MSSTRSLRWLALLIAVAVATVILIYFHNRFWLPRDDGYYAHIADRILRGERLHRDIQALHPGWAYYVNAAALRLFGHDLLSLRYPLIIAGVVQAILVFLILEKRSFALAVLAVPAVTAISIVQFFSPTAHWYCLPLFFLIVLTLAVDERSLRWRLEVLGFLIATLFLFRQLTGLFVAMGAVTYLLLERRPSAGRSGYLARAILAVMIVGLVAYLARKTDLVGWVLFGIWPLLLIAIALARVAADDRAVARLVLRLSLGAAGAVLPMLLYNVATGALAAWLTDVFVDAVALGEFSYQRTARYGAFLMMSVAQLKFPSAQALLNSTYWLTLLLATTALGALNLVSILRGGREQGARDPLPWLASFYGLVTVHYQDPAYIYYAASPVLAGLLWYAARLQPALRVVPAAAVTAIAAIALYFHAGQPITRSYAAVIAGQRHELVQSAAPSLSGLYLTPSDKETYETLLEVIARHSAPDDPILGVPAEAELFFLTGRRNPLRYGFLPFGIRDDRERARVLETLGKTPPRVVVHVPDLPYNTAHTDAIMNWVRERYERLSRVREFEIYVLPR